MYHIPVLKSIHICLVLLTVITSTACSKQLETWQTQNGDLKIRVTSYSDPGIFPGAKYIFESSHGEENWQTIFEISSDYQEPIDTESVSFLNDDVAYIGKHYMFASTVNGGREWHVWDARDHKFSDEILRWGSIRFVTMDEAGNVEIVLRVFPSDGCLPMYSTDFGNTWIENGPAKACSEP